MNKKLHVVLDLDETLIHGDVLNVYANDQTFKSTFDVPILLRPHVLTFLKKSFESFGSVSLYSAAIKEWIDQALLALNISEQQFAIILDRNYLKHDLKDLTTIYNTEIAKKLNMNETNTLLVDDSLYHGTYQPTNFIHIKAYNCLDEQDNELNALYNKLVQIQEKLIYENMDVRMISKLSLNIETEL